VSFKTCGNSRARTWPQAANPAICAARACLRTFRSICL